MIRRLFTQFSIKNVPPDCADSSAFYCHNTHVHITTAQVPSYPKLGEDEILHFYELRFICLQMYLCIIFIYIIKKMKDVVSVFCCLIKIHMRSYYIVWIMKVALLKQLLY